MDKRQLGRTDLRVSAFGMGCGNFGGIGSSPEFFGQGESESEAFVLLDRAVDFGINFFDTADAYGGGRSETTIGKWLRTKGSAVRDRLLISSKVGNAVGDSLDRSGLSRSHVLRQVDESLSRLGVDCLDMYLVHEIDATTPMAEVVGVFDEVIRLGKVRYVGLSNHPAELLREALNIGEAGGLNRFEWVQNSLNLVDRDEQADTLAVCREYGLGFTPFSPLLGGWLTGKYRGASDYPTGSRMTMRPEPYEKYLTPTNLAGIDKLADAAADLGISAAGLALAWLHHHPDVTAPIVGPRRFEHLAPVGEALALDLTPESWAEVGAFFRD